MRKSDLAFKHGTPQEFAAAVWRACWDGFLEVDQASEAIERYEAEYGAAP